MDLPPGDGSSVLDRTSTADLLCSVRSVTLVLRSMEGIAYTTGSELDDDHKEIHLSTDYIGSVSAERVRNEILGVVRHEMVIPSYYASEVHGELIELSIGALLAI